MKADRKWTLTDRAALPQDRHNDCSFSVVGVADEVDIRIVAPTGHTLWISMPRWQAERLGMLLAEVARDGE